MNSGKRNELGRAGLIWLISLVVVAFAVRLLFLIQLAHSPIADMLVEDSRVYQEWALRIAGGDWIGDQVFHALPFYPYYLGAVYSLIGEHLQGARFIQVLLGTLNCWLIYLVGRRYFRIYPALLGASMTAVYGWLIVYDSAILSPTLIVTLSALLLLSLVRAERNRSLAWCFLSGFLAGLTTTVGAHIILFIPLVMGWMIFRFRKSLRLWAPVIFLLSSLVVPGLTAWRNYQVGKDFVPLTAHGGINFFIGNNPRARGVFEPPPGLRTGGETMRQDAALLAQKARGRKLKPSEVSDFWFKKGLDFYRETPGQALMLLGKKALIFWDGLEIADVIHPFFFRDYAPLIKFPFLLFSWVAPLCLLGLILAAPGWRDRLLLYLFILAYYLSAVLYFINSRYRLPLVPFLLLFAGYALVWGKENFRRCRYLRFYLTLAGLVFLTFFVVNPGWRGKKYARFHLNMGAGYNHLGSFYVQQKDLDRALVQFKKARDLEPNRAEANFNLAQILARKKKYPEAEKYCREAIRINPYYLSAHILLGLILEESSREDEAIRQYSEVILNVPDDPRAYLNLTRLFLRQNLPGEAEKVMLKGLEHKKDEPLFYLYLSLARERGSDLPAALSALEDGLRVFPQNSQLLLESGRLLLRDPKMVPAACGRLQRARRINPGQALTHYFLGEGLSRMGDDKSARESWAEAYRLNPNLPGLKERLSLPSAP